MPLSIYLAQLPDDLQKTKTDEKVNSSTSQMYVVFGLNKTLHPPSTPSEESFSAVLNRSRAFD